MTLKRQLLVASLLMLLIPWAGLQFVLELDDALRQQAREQLRMQAKRLAGTAGDALIGQTPVTSGQPAIYVEPLDRSLNLDGYPDDWPGYEEGEQAQPWQGTDAMKDSGQPGLQWQAASDGRHLYLLIRISNRKPTLYDPGNADAPHDRVRLWLQPPDDTVGVAAEDRSWLIRATAPGTFYAVTGADNDTPDYRVTGSWQSTRSGWQLELQMPEPPAGSRLGFAARWSNDNPPAGVSTPVKPMPVLVRPDHGLERQLEPRLNPGQSVRVIEPGGWVIARQQLTPGQARPEFDQLSPLQVTEQISLNALRALIRFYQPEPAEAVNGGSQLAPDTVPPEGLVQHDDGSIWLLTTEPVFGGRTLILEQSLDQLLTLSGSTLGSVIARSTLIIVGLTLVLLGYASWLSWRITRLQRAVSASVDEDGRITGSLPPSGSDDELGQLQRHFSQMVDRLHGYNRYLESFSRRLSHELKTPVAVVRSSLENLSHSESESERQQYLERASAATDRLRQILNGMSEAARLEQSFDHADKEHFELAEVASQASAAYQSLDPHHQIRYVGPEHGCAMTGSPELMVQLLDKLVDNARDFTPEGGLIQVELEGHPDGLWLSVFNEGSALPGDSGTDIFGPFVSLREGQEEGHLGQGLLIARLIADFHGGRVEAANGVQGGIDGVRFRVIIPTANS
ncbi:ATP-binding protein [Marinobacter sp. F4206]|uniref:ATP-binding protein n=1 Tax=Marinobacter sp. F4206 TaxID=2861777 RepID=UPI001C5D740A|nr:ATP-binding protein [Marinobacter sp. F4206]MBW4934778.1 HAMP domain-containing protein [Marinobacter sp. F4206]